MEQEQQIEEWRLLRGKSAVWHRTSLAGLTAILRDREIKPNTDGRFDREYGQSDISYARHLEGVSLLDFDSETEARIEEHVDKYGLISSLPAQVIIEISRSSLEPSRLLLPAVMTTGTDPRLDALPPEIRRARMYVPAVEAVHIGPIPASTFRGFILVGRDDAGKRLWTHFPVAAVDELQAAAKEWFDQCEAARTERHARGDFTLAEVLSRRQLPPKRQRTADEIADIRRELRRTFGLEES